jgi:hypothetical protein
MEAHCYFVFHCESIGFETCVIFYTIAMITIFCTVVLLVIQGVALNTEVLPFSKGRALQNGIRA